jgi:hypothetical protein
MDLPLFLYPSAAGLSFAAAAVAAGAPLFSDGLRTLRLNRLLSSMKESSLADTLSGFVHVQGEVSLESPLFSPLSGEPCAGFRLEVRGIGTPVMRAAEVYRPFRIGAEGVTARVHVTHARWDLAETATRDVTADEPLTQHLDALLASVPEALWLRRTGAKLRLTERALLVGTRCHVVGYARMGRAHDVVAETELARTGTDDAVVVASAAGASTEPELRIDSGEHLNFLLVSDHAPDPARLAIARARTAGVVLGPTLSLLGMLYFAHTADYLRSLGPR